MDRITAPTLSSIGHAKSTPSYGNVCECCLKRSKEADYRPKCSQSKRWWCETTRHITNLKSSLIRKKMIPRSNTVGEQGSLTTRSIVDNVFRSTRKVDEIAASVAADKSKIPIFPRLRLSRNSEKKEKVACPMTVTYVQFHYLS